MDIFLFALFALTIITGGYILLVFVHYWGGNTRLKCVNTLKKAEIVRTPEKNPSHRKIPQVSAEPAREMGAWVQELAELAHIDPEQFWDDEMPADLRTFLPLVQGFVKSGGLERLLAGAGAVEEPSSKSVWETWD